MTEFLAMGGYAAFVWPAWGWRCHSGGDHCPYILAPQTGANPTGHAGRGA